jgi:hypothetical protein
MTDKSIMITGEENIRIASYLALRGALKLETKGLKKHGRSARAIANELMGTRLRTAAATYPAFDAWLAENYGIESRPLT